MAVALVNIMNLELIWSLIVTFCVENHSRSNIRIESMQPDSAYSLRLDTSCACELSRKIWQALIFDTP